MDCEEAQSPVLPVVQPLPPSRLIRHHHRDAERDEIHSPSDIMGHSKGHIKGKNKGKNKDKKRKVSKNVFESHSNSSTSSSSDSGNESDIGTGRGVGGGEIATVAQSWTSSRAKATPPVPVPAPVTTAPLPFFPPEKGNSTAAATTPTAKRDARGEVKKEVKKEAAALSAKKDPKSKVPVRQAAIREKGSTQAQVHVQGLGYAKAEVGTREREGAGDGGEDLGEDLGETVCGKQGQDESAAVFQSVVTTIYSNHKGISSSGSGTGCVKALTAKMRTPLQQSQKLELLLHSHEGDDEEAASFAVAAQVRGSGGESAPKSKSRVSHHVTVTGEKKKM